MGSYGARTPKRTRLWSNSKVISGFFTSEKLKLVKHVHYKTTKRYKDSTGQERFQGNKKLADTGIYTRAFACKAVRVFTQNVHMRRETQHPWQEATCEQARSMFAQLEYDDLWEDAGLVSVVRYLRGCQGLSIPPQWKPLLPTRL